MGVNCPRRQAGFPNTSIAQRWSAQLSQQIVVDNRAGAMRNKLRLKSAIG